MVAVGWIKQRKLSTTCSAAIWSVHEISFIQSITN